MSEKQYIERYWRDATPEDAIKEPPMVARFRDKDEGSWRFDVLSGWNRRSLAKWLCGCLSWRFCQVYDAPDPGEGWRLVDPDKDNYKQDGIEYREVWQAKWNKRDELSWTPFSPKTFYRIRITPAVTYVPFTWEDREQLRGRIITFVYQNSTIEFRCESFSVYDDEFLVNDFCAKWLCKNAVFVDTKEPVGKKVVQ